MWNKSQSEAPGNPTPMRESNVPGIPQRSPVSSAPAAPSARNVACLGPTVSIKGEISGDEDLQIDGKVEGAVTLRNHRLTVGSSAQLSSEINAREVVVLGKVVGNLRVRDRVEIKKNGEVVGNINTSRLSIEDGAYFKGRIEIERPATQSRHEQAESAEVPAAVAI